MLLFFIVIVLLLHGIGHIVGRLRTAGDPHYLVMSVRGQSDNCDAGVTDLWYGFPEGSR